MTTLFTKNLLISLPAKGCIWCFALFVFFFFSAHIIKLAKEGWQARHTKTDDNADEKTDTKKETPAPSVSPQPIYYIVEKKRRRPKQDYGEPKSIKFQ